MAKKPASPNPEPESGSDRLPPGIGIIGAGLQMPWVAPPEGAKEIMDSLDKGMEGGAIANYRTPGGTYTMPGLRDITGILESSPTREEFDALKARVDALAAHHLQTYGRAI